MIARTPKIVFCFAGQGYAPVEAARDLFRSNNTFREAILKVDSEIGRLAASGELERTFIPISQYLQEEEMRKPHTRSFDEDIAQATDAELTTPDAPLVIFASQYALARTIQGLGIEPNDIVGYSLGEHCASMVTGSLPLAAGLKLLIRRQLLFADRDLIPCEGGMLTVQAPPCETATVLAKTGIAGTADISGYPHPKSTILSGSAEALDEIQDRLEDEGVEHQRRALPFGMHATHVLGVSKALRTDPNVWPEGHSDEFKVKPGVSHWSNVSGTQLHEGTPLNANYWATHLVTPIHFKQCIEGIYESARGSEILFLDLGMGPRLTRLVQNTLQETPEWKDGRIQAINCIVSTSMTDEVKSKAGWAADALHSSLKPLLAV